MFNNNRHLNIFEHYTQSNSLPIENNVSRGLAIVLQENPLLLDRLLDYVNAGCTAGLCVQKHGRAEEIDIGIQQSVTKIVDAYPSTKLIIGMTLTTEKHVQWTELKEKSGDALIADIVIQCKDSLIVIEVKRNATDARAQVQAQVESIVAEMRKRNEDAPTVDYVNGSWEDIIELLSQVYSITGKDERSILGHYLKHLEHRYGQWFPVSLLSELAVTPENQAQIDKRLLKLIQNCCDNEDDEKKYTGRYIIPLNYCFLSEAQLDMDYDRKSLMVTIWPGDTKWQAYNLFKTTQHDLSWLNTKQFTLDGANLELVVRPYLRFAHFQSTIFAPYINRAYYDQYFGTDKEKCMRLWKEITREWKRNTWDELKEILLVKHCGLLDEEEFTQGFNDKFEQSKRGYVHVSFGYEVTAYIPEKVFVHLEKKGGCERKDDALAKFIRRVLRAMLDQIV